MLPVDEGCVIRLQPKGRDGRGGGSASRRAVTNTENAGIHALSGGLALRQAAPLPILSKVRLAVPMRPGPGGTLIAQGPPRDWLVIWGHAARVRSVPGYPSDSRTALLEAEGRTGEAALYLVDLNTDTDRPLFATVHGDSSGEPHALAPNTEAGPTLCGLVEPEPGWIPLGHTPWRFLIQCGRCRSQALRAEVVCAGGQWA